MKPATVAPGAALDAACGTGRHARRLAELGHHVIGVDASPAMLERARAALPQATFLPALRRGNVFGALDMGLAPGILPGRISAQLAALYEKSVPRTARESYDANHLKWTNAANDLTRMLHDIKNAVDESAAEYQVTETRNANMFN